MSEQQWYYRKGGKRGGPVTGSELRRMATDGELAPGDSVRAVGMTEWLPAGDFEDLFPKPDPVKRQVDAIFGDLAPKPPAAPPVVSPTPAAPSMTPPVRRGPPPVPPPVPTSMLPPSTQPPPSYGAVDQGNPYAGFGLNSSDYTTPSNPYAPNPYATAATPNPYSPVAGMNQQDILAAEAARAANDAAVRQAAEASAREARIRSSYSATSAYGSSPRSSSLQTIASLRRWMLGSFGVGFFCGLLYWILLFTVIVPGVQAGGQLSARGTVIISTLYLTSAIAGIMTIVYICRLAYHLGRSALLYFLLCFVPFGSLIALISLNNQATARLSGRRY